MCFKGVGGQERAGGGGRKTYPEATTRQHLDGGGLGVANDILKCLCVCVLCGGGEEEEERGQVQANERVVSAACMVSQSVISRACPPHNAAPQRHSCCCSR